MQVTDQRWISKCNDQGITQIIAISHTFLPSLGLEVVPLWRLRYSHALLSTDTEQRHTNLRYHPKQCLQTLGLCVGRQQTQDLELAEFSWRQSSAGGMAQAKGMSERPWLFTEHNKRATMKWSFKTKSKHHEIQVLSFAQRMQGLTRSDLLQTLLLWGRKKKRKKRQGKDGEEHYFYIRAIKFLYKQDSS